MALLSLNHVTMGYENVTAVEDVTVSFEKGDYAVIVGENGSGKSTLIKGMLGLVKPRAGTIEAGDGLKQTEIGYLPQQTAAQKDFPASVREVVLSGCLNRRGFFPFYTKEDKARADAAMERFAITNLQKKSYRDLSGGQQQRVLLARALCATERLLLLDEPVTGLDPHAAGKLYAIIRDLNREKGVCIVMVSHDVTGALRDANKILCMHERKMAFSGTAEEYIEKHCGDLFQGVYRK